MKRPSELFSRIRAAVHRNIPRPAQVIYLLLALTLLMGGVARLHSGIADFLNSTVSAFSRAALALFSNLLPFSIGEGLLYLIIPAIVFLVILAYRHVKTALDLRRFLFSFLCIPAVLGILFQLTLAPAYAATSLDRRLSLDRRGADAAALYQTVLCLQREANTLVPEMIYRPDGFSMMPYSFEEMNAKLLEAYDSLSDEYPFIGRMETRLKPVMASEAMSYLHLTGVYSYMTGEANVNIVFPDYTLPFTAAHELAHQRGIAREDEANFIAFLVCIRSRDPYIRYSGYVNMLEYVDNALYAADYSLFEETYLQNAVEIQRERIAYNDFYEKYRDNIAADVSGAINDAYLQIQGTPGVRSYGMVVDLAVAYYRD